MLSGILGRMQVSISLHSRLKQCLPGCEIRDIAELQGMEGLELKWN